MSLDRLETLLRPTHRRRGASHEDWCTAEQRLGTALPDDYKALVDLYGAACVNDFLAWRSPFAEGNSSLFANVDAMHEATRVKRLNFANDPTSIVHPFDLYPRRDGLLVWGTTTNAGDFLFWQVSGPPNRWPVVAYNLRDGAYDIHERTLTEFLAGVLTGELRVKIFPDDFPGSGPLVVR